MAYIDHICLQYNTLLKYNIRPMEYYTCTDDGNEFWSAADLIEHIRKHYASFIGRPGCPGITDSHGHIWYCFDCEQSLKDHRSFDSDKAMLDHFKQCHGDIMSFTCEY